MTQFTNTLQKFDSDLWKFHLPVSITIADRFINGNDRRVVCTINNELQIQSPLIPYSEDYLLLMNKDLVKRLNLSVGNEVN